MQRLQIECDDDGTDLVIIPKSKIVRAMDKPVMSEAVERDVQNVLARFQNRELWEKWGLDDLREQGSAVLLKGPPGTGKTVIAKYIARLVGKGFKLLDVGTLSAGGEPGAMERSVRDFFADCKKRHNATIVIDECDHLLGDRTKIQGDALTWMLGTTETLMMEMNRYKGLILCMTNHVQIMDEALNDRFLFIINVGVPDFKGRLELWKQKIPKSFPLQPDRAQLKTLAKHVLTGRQIETVILNTASEAIRTGVRPTLRMLLEFAERAKERGLR